jgi:hypothetical protein
LDATPQNVTNWGCACAGFSWARAGGIELNDKRPAAMASIEKTDFLVDIILNPPTLHYCILRKAAAEPLTDS